MGALPFGPKDIAAMREAAAELVARLGLRGYDNASITAVDAWIDSPEFRKDFDAGRIGAFWNGFARFQGAVAAHVEPGLFGEVHPLAIGPARNRRQKERPGRHQEAIKASVVPVSLSRAGAAKTAAPYRRSWDALPPRPANGPVDSKSPRETGRFSFVSESGTCLDDRQVDRVAGW